MTVAKKRLTTTTKPVLTQDFQLIEKVAHFNRQRIPERETESVSSPVESSSTSNPDRSPLGQIIARSMKESCP